MIKDNAKWRADTAIVLVLAAVLALLPIFYVLSIGPALQLRHRHKLSREAFCHTYAPIIYLSERCKPVADALVDYDHWWRDITGASTVHTSRIVTQYEPTADQP